MPAKGFQLAELVVKACLQSLLSGGFPPSQKQDETRSGDERNQQINSSLVPSLYRHYHQRFFFLKGAGPKDVCAPEVGPLVFAVQNLIASLIASEFEKTWKTPMASIFQLKCVVQGLQYLGFLNSYCLCSLMTVFGIFVWRVGQSFRLLLSAYAEPSLQDTNAEIASVPAIESQIVQRRNDQLAAVLSQTHCSMLPVRQFCSVIPSSPSSFSKLRCGRNDPARRDILEHLL
mmetsp:Transcript_39652/g.95809  ORF Transcript_39652/g.95809 Transcript_39652/m.95809 type:complete len:231 (+) Transcript_39652:1856-2548(+)